MNPELSCFQRVKLVRITAFRWYCVIVGELCKLSVSCFFPLYKMGILYCLLHKIVRIDCYVKYEEYSKHSVTFSDVDDINSDDA